MKQADSDLVPMVSGDLTRGGKPLFYSRQALKVLILAGLHGQGAHINTPSFDLTLETMILSYQATQSTYETNNCFV